MIIKKPKSCTECSHYYFEREPNRTLSYCMKLNDNENSKVYPAKKSYVYSAEAPFRKSPNCTLHKENYL